MDHEIFGVLDSPSQEGYIRMRNPSVFIFPGGKGDSAFFCVDDYTVLVNGGSLSKPWFWRLIRHYCRLDCMISTHMGSDSLEGINSLLERKLQERNINLPMDVDSDEYKRLVQHLISPEMGLFFVNFPKNLSLEDAKSNEEIAVVQKAMQLTKKLEMMVRPLINKNPLEPITLFMKAGIGKLDMYPLLPEYGSKELAHICDKYGASDELTSTDEMMRDLASICCLLVWHPESPKEKIVRVLFPGNAKQDKILEAFDKLKQLDFLRCPLPTPASLKEMKKKAALSPTKSSTTATNRRTTIATSRNVSSAPSRTKPVPSTTKPAPSAGARKPAPTKAPTTTTRPTSARPAPKKTTASTTAAKKPATTSTTAPKTRPGSAATTRPKPSAATSRPASAKPAPSKTNGTTSTAAKKDVKSTAARITAAKKATTASAKSSITSKPALSAATKKRPASAKPAATSTSKTTSKKPASAPAAKKPADKASTTKKKDDKTKPATPSKSTTATPKKAETPKPATPPVEVAAELGEADKMAVLHKRPSPEGEDGNSDQAFIEAALKPPIIDEKGDAATPDVKKDDGDVIKDNNDEKQQVCGDYLSLDQTTATTAAQPDVVCKEPEPDVIPADVIKSEPEIVEESKESPDLIKEQTPTAGGPDLVQSSYMDDIGDGFMTTTTMTSDPSEHNVMVANDDTVIVTDDLLTPQDPPMTFEPPKQHHQVIMDEDGMTEMMTSQPDAITSSQQQDPISPLLNPDAAPFKPLASPTMTLPETEVAPPQLMTSDDKMMTSSTSNDDGLVVIGNGSQQDQQDLLESVGNFKLDVGVPPTTTNQGAEERLRLTEESPMSCGGDTSSMATTTDIMTSPLQNPQPSEDVTSPMIMNASFARDMGLMMPQNDVPQGPTGTAEYKLDEDITSPTSTTTQQQHDNNMLLMTSQQGGDIDNSSSLQQHARIDSPHTQTDDDSAFNSYMMNSSMSATFAPDETTSSAAAPQQQNDDEDDEMVSSPNLDAAPSVDDKHEIDDNGNMEMSSQFAAAADRDVIADVNDDVIEDEAGSDDQKVAPATTSSDDDHGEAVVAEQRPVCDVIDHHDNDDVVMDDVTHEEAAAAAPVSTPPVAPDSPVPHEQQPTETIQQSAVNLPTNMGTFDGPPHYNDQDVSPTAPLAGSADLLDHSEFDDMPPQGGANVQQQSTEIASNMVQNTENIVPQPQQQQDPFMMDFSATPDPGFVLRPNQPDPQMPAVTTTRTTSAGLKKKPASASSADKKPAATHITSYVDLTYVPHHAHQDFVGKSFFEKVRSRYYVLSGIEEECSTKVLDGLLEGVKTWNKDAPEKSTETSNVTVIPTQDSANLAQWFEKNYDELESANINMVTSHCKVFMHNETIEACKIEF